MSDTQPIKEVTDDRIAGIKIRTRKYTPMASSALQLECARLYTEELMSIREIAALKGYTYGGMHAMLKREGVVFRAKHTGHAPVAK